MASNTGKTIITGAEEEEQTFIKRTGRFLYFFKIEWWEKISATHLGNDIMIKTARPIRQVYLNGKELINN